MRTEQISPRYVELDSWSAAEMIAAMYEGQLAAAAAVRGALGAIAAAVDDAVPALQRGGRIVYAGAGTSGRIGVQDGSELPPTFDWPADRLVFAMAGGLDALVRSAEGAEDNEAAGAQAMADANIGADDVVIGIAASGTTPFTIGVLRASSAAGAVTIAVANNRTLRCSRLRVIAFSPTPEARRSPVHADERGHGPEDRAEPVLHGRDGEDGPRLSRADGGHAGAECQAAPPRRSHRQRNRPLSGGRRGAPSRTGRGDVKTAILIGLGLGSGEAAQLLQRHGGNLRSAINEATARMAEPQTASAMAREIAEIPAVAEGLLARSDLFAAIGERIARAKPRIVVFCGRGSSVMSAFICATCSKHGLACSRPPPHLPS